MVAVSATQIVGFIRFNGEWITAREISDCLPAHFEQIIDVFEVQGLPLRSEPDPEPCFFTVYPQLADRQALTSYST
jgi:hypothetical protein